METSPEYNKLRECVDDLYIVFESHPLPDYINCNTKQKNSRLHCLKQLSRNDMYWDWEYSVGDIKGLLPRVFELIAFEGSYEHRIEDIKQLYFVDWTRWKPEETAAISRYLINLWKYLLSDYPSPLVGAYEIAYEIYYIHTDMTVYFKILEERCSDIVGIRHLSNLVGWEGLGDKLAKQSWILPTLEKAYYEHMNTPIGDEIATAVKDLEYRQR